MVPDSFHTHTHRGVMSVNVRRLCFSIPLVILIKCVSHYYTYTHTHYTLCTCFQGMIHHHQIWYTASILTCLKTPSDWNCTSGKWHSLLKVHPPSSFILACPCLLAENLNSHLYLHCHVLTPRSTSTPNLSSMSPFIFSILCSSSFSLTSMVQLDIMVF